jgi:H+/Cl- antiporter ClcA
VEGFEDIVELFFKLALLFLIKLLPKRAVYWLEQQPDWVIKVFTICMVIISIGVTVLLVWLLVRLIDLFNDWCTNKFGVSPFPK